MELTVTSAHFRRRRVAFLEPGVYNVSARPTNYQRTPLEKVLATSC